MAPSRVIALKSEVDEGKELELEQGGQPFPGPLGSLLAVLEQEAEGLVEHLAELRIRLIIYLVALGAGSIAGWWLTPHLLALFAKSVGRLIFIAPAEALLTKIKIAFSLGFVFSLPVGLFQLWRFVAPALFPEEKSLFRWFLGLGSFLFASGLVFGYTVVYPVALSFFLRFDTEGLRAAIVVSRHFLFFLGTTLSFALAFQLPLALLILVRAGIVSAARLKEMRRPAIFFCAVAAAVLTPADAVSHLLMAVPLAILYELTVWLAPRFERREDSPEPGI